MLTKSQNQKNIINSSFNQIIQTQQNFKQPLKKRRSIKQIHLTTETSERTRTRENSHIVSYQNITPSTVQSFYTPNSTLETNFTYNKIRRKINNDNNNYKKITPLKYSKNERLNLDQKILLAQENKKLILNKKNEMYIEQYKNKEKKFNEMRENTKMKKIYLMNKIKKLNDMRRLKLKINKIIQMESYDICNEFEAKNSSFNIKSLDYLSGKHNLNQSIKFHSIFRFDKIENGEAHDRYKMLIDIDSMKNNEELKDKILEKKLSIKEKRLINEDPSYFFQSNVGNNFKKISLTDRINEEDGFYKIKDETINLDSNKKESKGRNLKEKLSKRLKTDINKNLLDIKKDINKTIYKIRTKKLNHKENLAQIEHDKIIQNMIDSLKNNYSRNINDNEKERRKMYKTVFKYGRRRFSTLFHINNDLNINNNNNDEKNNNENPLISNFKKEEIDFIKVYKKQIKDNFSLQYQ